MQKVGARSASKIDMVNGHTVKAIVAFAIPLLLGNLLQQLYNTVDSIVVGNLVGSAALAAVGTSGPIIHLMLAFFLGISSGASIVVSHAIGKGDHQRLERIVHTVLALALIAGLVLGAVGMALTPTLLHWLNTPPDVFQMACEYMRVSFAGVLMVLLFNVVNGVLQGMGDSRTPLLILMICSCANVVLDLLFVAVLHLAVGGVAWATAASQLLSVVFGLICLNRNASGVKVRFSALCLDRSEIAGILKLGVPTGLQNSLQSVGNILVQSVINSFGAVIMAANIAVIKVDSFCTMPMMTFTTAITVFAGQNIGAKRTDRVIHGMRVALALSVSMALSISLLLVLAGPALLRLFTQDAAVVQAGMDKIHIIAPFYFCMGVFGIVSGVIRGSGQAFVPMLVGITTMFLGRVPVAFWLSQRIGANGIHWSLSIQWGAEAIIIVLYYLLFYRKKLLHSAQLEHTFNL